jgi:hypothetical protein
VTGCRSDDQCTDPRTYCNAGTCAFGGCRIFSDGTDNCGTGLMCSPETHLCRCHDCGSPAFLMCIPGTPTTNDVCQTVQCLSNTDCQTGNICVSGACMPGGPSSCTSNADCPSTQFCSSSGTCVTGCRSDDVCSAPDYCNSGTCSPGCRIFSDGTDNCGTGLMCSPETHMCRCHDCGTGTLAICVPGTPTTNDQCVAVACVSNTDCASNQICVSNNCVSGCRSDDVCGVSDYCNAGTCSPGCRIFSDGTDNCGTGLVCSSATHLCRCGVCPTSPPTICVPGTPATNDQCVAVACVSNTDCAANQICVSNNCVLGCGSSADCATGQVCSSGVCVPG